jgi:fructose-1,6-bisphosphatase/inositol monophosphatase family enzyme
MESSREFCFKTAKRIANRFKKSWEKDPEAACRTVGIGADGTPTQLIDKLCEQEAIRSIREEGESLNLLSEEVGWVDFGAENTLVLDPIDGTRNACRGIPFFCTSLAIGRSMLSDVFYGLVLNIPTGDFFEAVKGKGGWMNGKRMDFKPPTQQKPIISYSNSENTELGRKILEHSYLRALGACALEICLVARGSLSGYIMERSGARISDIAAGSLILREAGGEVYTGKGDILEMKFDIKDRTDVFAFRSKKLFEEFKK